MKKYAKEANEDEMIRTTIKVVKLSDFLGSLLYLCNLYEKGRFNAKARYVLLIKAAMDGEIFSHFLLIKFSHTFIDLRCFIV